MDDTSVTRYKLSLLDKDGFLAPHDAAQLTFLARVRGQEWPAEPTDLGHGLTAKVKVNCTPAALETGKDIVEFKVLWDDDELDFFTDNDGSVPIVVKPNPERIVKIVPVDSEVAVAAGGVPELKFALVAETEERFNLNDKAKRQLDKAEVSL